MPSPMMLDDDAHKLVRYAREIDARVLALETVVEHFGDRGGKSRRSTNNEADVRSALSPFRAVCAKAGLYGLGAIHPRKSTDGTVDDSISGSAAFRNVTRSAHHIYRDPEDETEDPVRLLFTSKANYLSRRPPTLRFQIRSWDEHFGMPCACLTADCGHEGRVVWESELIDDRTAEEVWQQIAERSKPRRDVAVQAAEEFLKGLMQDGKIGLPPDEIFAMAATEEITKAALKRAKDKLRLVSKKAGFPAVVVGWEVEEMTGPSDPPRLDRRRATGVAHRVVQVCVACFFLGPSYPLCKNIGGYAEGRRGAHCTPERCRGALSCSQHQPAPLCAPQRADVREGALP